MTMTMTEPKANALQSLWGSGDVDKDRARRNTAKSMISPGGRPQEIYTPQVVLDVVRAVWPEGIALDPCSGPDSVVGAEVVYDGVTKNGLAEPWVDHTYFNPPYKNLKQWLGKANVEAFEKGIEIIGLVPVRTHRQWWRKVVFGDVDAISWLDPLKFRGYDQAFPAPLCLLYWGQRTEAFHAACSRVSKPS